MLFEVQYQFFGSYPISDSAEKFFINQATISFPTILPHAVISTDFHIPEVHYGLPNCFCSNTRFSLTVISWQLINLHWCSSKLQVAVQRWQDTAFPDLLKQQTNVDQKSQCSQVRCPVGSIQRGKHIFDLFYEETNKCIYELYCL